MPQSISIQYYEVICWPMCWPLLLLTPRGSLGQHSVRCSRITLQRTQSLLLGQPLYQDEEKSNAKPQFTNWKISNACLITLMICYTHHDEISWNGDLEFCLVTDVDMDFDDVQNDKRKTKYEQWKPLCTIDTSQDVYPGL